MHFFFVDRFTFDLKIGLITLLYWSQIYFLVIFFLVLQTDNRGWVPDLRNVAGRKVIQNVLWIFLLFITTKLNPDNPF